jgi:hypothetical protein
VATLTRWLVMSDIKTKLTRLPKILQPANHNPRKAMLAENNDLAIMDYESHVV